MNRILIVEDHQRIRECLIRTLLRLPELVCVGEAEDGEQALRMVEHLDWDLVLLDISMPKANGFDVLRQIARHRPNLPVLMVSSHPEEEYALRAIKAGAAGYVLKERADEILIDAVRLIAKGGVYLNPALGALPAPGRRERLFTRSSGGKLCADGSGAAPESSPATARRAAAPRCEDPQDLPMLVPADRVG